jgi:hypothetical protein
MKTYDPRGISNSFFNAFQVLLSVPFSVDLYRVAFTEPSLDAFLISIVVDYMYLIEGQL